MVNRADILVVDDDPDLQESLRIVLEANGFRVRTAKNGRQARQELAARRPDLMVLDVMMDTDTEGFDLAHELKSRPDTMDLPIILLTCFLEKVRVEGPEQYQHIMGEDWPVDWMFEKPVDMVRLVDKIEAVLARRPQAGAVG